MIQTQTSSHRLSVFAFLLLAFALVVPSAASANNKVQRPKVHAKTKNAERTRAIKQARSRRVKPQVRKDMTKKLIAHAKRISSTNAKLLSDASFRDAVSRAPLSARVEVFKAMVKGKGGEPVQSFTRRLRGMLRQNGRNRATKSQKTFFEVTEANLDLFHQTMGQNVVWFAASESPGHLHTLIADQAGGERLTHNTYGHGTLKNATISSLGQFAAPVLLTDKQMDRFTRYLNAGLASSPKTQTYGFKKGADWVCDIRCTNWATSAPIGDKARWIKTVDKRVMKASQAGTLGPEFKEGLHAALAKTTDKAGRDALLAQVTPAAVGKWGASSAKRLGKEFNLVQEKTPNRPLDLVGRESLAGSLGLGRSQDPAKWTYDLLMSKKVPVVAWLTKNKTENFKDKTFNMEIMGTINKKGVVVKGSAKSLGVIRQGRSPFAPPAEEQPTRE